MSIPPLKSFGNWTEQKSSSGKIYFYNKQTEVSQWEKPQEWKENDAKLEQDRMLTEKHKYQSTPIPPPMMHPPPPMGYIAMNMPPPPPPHFMPFPPGAPPPAGAHFQPPAYPGQYYPGPSNAAPQMYHPPPPPKAFSVVPPPPMVSRSGGIPPPPPPSSSSSSQHISSHDFFSSPSGSVAPPPPPPSDQAMHNSYIQSRREYDYNASPSTSHGKSNGSASIPSTPGDGSGGSIYKRELANLKNGQQHHNNNSNKRVSSPSVNSCAPVRKKPNNGSNNNVQDEQNKHKHNHQNENNEPSTSNCEKKDDESIPFSEMMKYYDPVMANEKAKSLGLMDEEGRNELQKITRESLALEATITAEHVASVGARCMVAAEEYAKRIFEEQWSVNQKSLQHLTDSIQDSVPDYPDFTNAMQMIAGKELLLLHDT